MRKRDGLKIIGFWALFMGLHFGYEAFPLKPVAWIAPINESVFQHMKGVFYAYALANVIEYGIRRKAIEQRVAFTYARILSTLMVPWIMAILWYMAPAYYGQIHSIPLEILYANVIMLLTGLATVIMERGFETMRYPRELKLLLVVLLVVAVSQYTLFTLKLPWADVFAIPAGWE